MMTPGSGRHPNRGAILLAFATVYLIWGSTYLAILFAIESLPPFLMAGGRFLVAGGILLAWSRLSGPLRITRRQLLTTMAVGSLLFLLGNGAVVWSEQRIPSGVAALIVAMVPLWIVLLEWLLPHGRRPDWRVGAGLLLGTAGLFLLLGPAGASLGEPIDLLGGSVLLLGTFCWAAGSLLTRHGENPSPPALATALQMLAGGVGLMLAAAVHGDFQAFDPAQVTLRSWLAVGYLVVFGALIGFSSYAYLLRTVRPTQVATYAYVNPVVAVFLGWMLAGEALTARSLIAMVVIVAAVVFITSSRAFRPTPRPQAPTSPRGV